MGLGLVVLLIAVVGAIFALGDRYDLGPLAAGRLTTSLARRVSIGSLHVTPGRWLHVELRDFQLDNLPGGTQPVMTTVTTASAEIEAMSAPARTARGTQAYSGRAADLVGAHLGRQEELEIRSCRPDRAAAAVRSKQISNLVRRAGYG